MDVRKREESRTTPKYLEQLVGSSWPQLIWGRLDRADLGREDQELSLGHVKLEMSIGQHPTENVE